MQKLDAILYLFLDLSIKYYKKSLSNYIKGFFAVFQTTSMNTVHYILFRCFDHCVYITCPILFQDIFYNSSLSFTCQHVDQRHDFHQHSCFRFNKLDIFSISTVLTSYHPMSSSSSLSLITPIFLPQLRTL